MISLQKSKSDFFNRRALFISADKLSIYHWDKGELGSSYLFDLDQAGRDNFKRYLQESVNTPMTILVDVIEEEFRQDTIPHVFGSDRQALIERKQSRLYRDASYLYTQNQGRETEGRRDDQLLFMALTNQEMIKPWLDLLEEHKVPLKGILSVSLLLQSYIKTLPDISDHALFVTMQSISGLRQTFFQKKELKISRLSKLARYGTESYAPRINAEVEKIQRYLNSLRLIPNDTSLDVYIFADKTTLDELENEKISSPMMRRHYLDITKLMETIQQDAVQAIPFSDKLLVHHLLKSHSKNCYASSHEMRYSKMRNIRYATNFTSVFILFFSLIYSGLNFMNGMTYKQESESSKNKAAFYQSRYDLARERLPKTPVEPAQVKVAVEAATKLDEYKSTPYEMFSFIGKGLEQYPEIKLDDFDWSFSIDPNKGAAAPSEKENKYLPPGMTNNNESEVKYYQISNIKAHIAPFDGNYREAIAVVNKFAETLRSHDSTYEVSIESFPLDISSTATLQGDAESVGKEALFSLRTVIGVTREKG
jgi:hypothetical protein